MAALAVTGVVLAGAAFTFLASWLLSRTILKGVPSTFILQLPPCRKPLLGRIIIRSLLDRTLFVLARAVMVAVPAGVLTWCLAHLYIQDKSLISHLVGLLDPLGKFLGLDGAVILAFILRLPANEIVLPLLLMIYLSSGTLVEVDNLSFLGEILKAQGWTGLTALNTMVLVLLHWPCGTTLLTIYRETGSWRWPLLAALLPTSFGLLTCLGLKALAGLMGL